MKTKIPFSETYLGRLRKHVGNETLIVPGFRIFIENDKREILAIRRADDGKWAFPAGCPEIGESMGECIRREVREETGIRLNGFQVFGFSSNPDIETHTYPNKDRVQSFVLLAYSKTWSGKPKVNDDEVLDLGFFSFKDLAKLRPALKHEFDSLKELKRYKKNGSFQWADR